MPAMEARYAAAWRAGDTAGAARELTSFTSDVLQQAGELLEGLAEHAALQLGMPGVPSDSWLLQRLEEAAEAYAFEPTSDDPPPPVCRHRHRRGDKRPWSCLASTSGYGSRGSSGSAEAGAAAVLMAHEAVTE